jgi:putative transposase
MHPGPAPAPVTVSPAQQAVLAALLRRTSCPQALALRARVILGAAAGQRNEPLARQAGCTPNTVRKWRSRWTAAAPHLAAADAERPALERAIAAALADAPRSGTPATFTAEQIVQIINLACSSPAQFQRPVDAWTPRELADEAVQQGIVATISPRSVERFLKGGRSAAPSQPLLAQRQGQAGRP